MEKDKLIYITDALCSWCYGFIPVMEEVHKKWKKQLDFVVMSGGMFAGSNEGPVGKVASGLGDEVKEVAKKTGAKFGDTFIKDILGNGKSKFTSVPAGWAMTVFKKQFPHKQLEFMHALQRGIFHDGIEPSDVAGLAALAVPFGADADAFAKSMKKSKTMDETEDEFFSVSELGVEGFPTLAYQHDSELYFVSYGCSDLATVEKAIASARKKAGVV
jgi:putative protein-disulfide isomerase